MKKRLKINGFIMFTALLLIALFPSIFLRRSSVGSLDDILEVFGIAFILLGQLIRASARGFKSEHSQDGRLLLQQGPYALVRNPMYLGILLIGLGITTVLFNWWVAYVFLSVFIIRYIRLIFVEEKKLQALFHEAYDDYCKRVPRIFPAVSAIFRNDIRDYLPLKVPWLKREIGSILAVLFVALALESWEDIRFKGLKAYLNEALLITITIIIFIGAVIYLTNMTGRPKKNASIKS